MASLTQLAKAANLDQMAERLILADLLEENGRDAEAELLRDRNLSVEVDRAGRVWCESDLRTQEAKELHAALEKFADARVEVPVLSYDRSLPRKQQASLARKLFRLLGLPYVRFRTPNYSMASTVDVEFPSRRDYTVRNAFLLIDFGKDPAALANHRAEQIIERILADAFPNHDDRSDSSSDYYNAKWSFNCR